jgi:trimethylamine--corrinoid protein Co-methyltransferase
MDVDQANMLDVLLEGVDLSENAQALDALEEVGPGSHFLGAAHTQANFETAFYRSTIADNNSFEQWEQDGAKTAETRANEQWKQMLESYAPPPLDEGLDEALQAFMKERKSSFEDRDY